MKKIGLLIQATDDKHLVRILRETAALQGVVVSVADLDPVSLDDEVYAVVIRVGDKDILTVRLTP